MWLQEPRFGCKIFGIIFLRSFSCLCCNVNLSPIHVLLESLYLVFFVLVAKLNFFEPWSCVLYSVLCAGDFCTLFSVCTLYMQCLYSVLCCVIPVYFILCTNNLCTLSLLCSTSLLYSLSAWLLYSVLYGTVLVNWYYVYMVFVIFPFTTLFSVLC